MLCPSLPLEDSRLRERVTNESLLPLSTEPFRLTAVKRVVIASAAITVTKERAFIPKVSE